MERVHADGLTLALDSAGPADGPRVLMLHGGGQTRFAWGGTQGALARRGYRAAALDLRGHGDSDWAPDGDYSPQTVARDLIPVVRRIGAPAALVGASMGGLAALLLAGEFAPELASSLVLVDVTPRVNPAGARRVLAFMRSRPDGFADLAEAADAVAAYIPHRPRPAENEGLSRNLRRGADGRWRWHWDPRMVEFPDDGRPIPTDRLLAAAERVRIPTLLVQGALSDVVTEATASELRTAIPHARHVTVGRAGHMVAGDQNDLFTAAVVEFLDGLPTRPAAK